MADEAVNSVHQLIQLLHENGEEIPDEVSYLCADLESLIAFFNRATEILSDNQILKHAIETAQSTFREAAFTFEGYVCEAKLPGNKGIKKHLYRLMTSKEVATQIKSIRMSLGDIRQSTVSQLQILQFEDPKKEKTKQQSERGLADAAMDFLMQNLAQFTEEKKGLIAGKENEVLSLVADLQSLIAFLKQATKSYSENEILKHLVKKMTIAVEDAKSAIEELVSASKLQSNKRKKVAVLKVESISERLKDIRRTDAYGLQILQYEEAYSRGLLERKKQSEREMADAAVDFLIQNLTELQQHKANMLVGLMIDVKYLLAYLQSLSPILKQATKSNTGKYFLKDVVKKIRTIVNEAEDTIDKFVIEAKLHHNKGIKKVFDVSYYIKIREVATQIKSIVEGLRGIWRTSANGLQTLQFEEANRRGPVERKRKMMSWALTRRQMM